MPQFFLQFAIFIIIFEFFNSVSYLLEEINFSSNFFIVYFLFMFLTNFFYIIKKENFNFNFDILLKFYLFLLRTPNLFFNFFFNILKQIYAFTFFFKYRLFIDTNSIFIKEYLKKILLVWKPLFKKFSYFGYYRSNRSKWLK